MPFIGEKTRFNVVGSSVNTGGVWVIGAKYSRLLIPGTRCYLAIDPVVVGSAYFGKLGTTSIPILMPNSRSLIGVGFWSQFGAFDKAANKGGLITSNALLLKCGGYH